MAELLLHKTTRLQIDKLIAEPSHAVLITAPQGAGKSSVVRLLAAKTLGTKPELVENYPYVKWIDRGKDKTIGIEKIRELEHFLSLKVPTSKALNRMVIIEDAEKLTIEAQNSLLKVLEEPPIGTAIIMSASSEQSLLPTVRSRATIVHLQSPNLTDLVTYFEAQGYPRDKVESVAAISGGLPGLMTALLSETEHDLLPAIAKAREILGQSPYARLTEVDALSKDRELTENLLFILQQMAEVQLKKAGAQSPEKWSKILQASYKSEQSIAGSGQIKLALTDLMLNLT